MRRGLSFAFCAAVFTLACDVGQTTVDGPRQANPGIAVDILDAQTYAVRGGQTLQFDLYRPADFAAGARPMVILIHGGSWFLDNRSDMTAWAYDLAAHGYVAATVDYRLAVGGVHYPLPVGDVLAAIRFFHDNAVTFGGDASRIGLFGVSAGAHMAMLCGLTTDASIFDSDLPPGQTVPITCVVDLFGRADLAASSENAYELLTLENFIGVPLDQAGDLLRQASPITYVRADGPPVLLIHGDADSLIPVTQSRSMHAALDAAGEENIYVEVPGMDHFPGLDWSGPFAQGYRQTVLSFLAEHLGGRAG
ncbi:MAG TPA: alpha/beta hydrolase [Phycisphaerae bacterium]|nr:alpha/beta hydrolase [Phycisphaerae bacterium]